MLNQLRSLCLVAVLLVLSACGGSGTTPTPPAPPTTPSAPATPAPTMKIFATGVPDCGAIGEQGLQFAVAPSENLQLLSVTISHEIGSSLGTFNLGGALTLPTERLALQGLDECYAKITGEYRFTFTVTRPNDTKQFTVNAVYNQLNAIRQ